MIARELLRLGIPLSLAVLIGFGSGYSLGWRVGNRHHVPIDPSKVLYTTVDSLKAENKLIVFRYSGQARVTRRETFAMFLDADQELVVPGSTVYFVDMSKFGRENVRYDPVSKTVEVHLPPLQIGDVAMQPENAIEINKGFITIASPVSEELAQKNYAAARSAFVRQAAQNRQLVGLAAAAATQAVAANFAVPLRAVGRKDINIKVSIAG